MSRIAGLKLTIKSVARHRNGVGGAPFWAIVFDDAENGAMVASLFDESYHCAVYSLAKLAEGNVAFGENSWRGDRYEVVLRARLLEWLKKHDPEVAAEMEARNTP